MIENKLTLHELTKVLRPFLRLEPVDSNFSALQDALGLSGKSYRDLFDQTKILFTFDGYHVQFTDLGRMTSAATAVRIQFKAKQKWWHIKSQKWWHGIFPDQNASLVRTLQEICRAEIADLDFSRFETTLPRIRKSVPSIRDWHVEDEVNIVYFHDSAAFNSDWQEPCDISPLLIGTDCHHGNCFVSFVFNGAAYERLRKRTVLDEFKGKGTVLNEFWVAHASSVSKSFALRSWGTPGGKGS